MKDLNDFYLKKENVKNELKLLEKEEKEGKSRIPRNERYPNQINQKR